MRKALSLFLLLAGPSFAQTPDFKVLAFYHDDVGRDEHKYFSTPLRDFFRQLSTEERFTFDVTDDAANMSDSVLRNYQVVMWINMRPYQKKQRGAFQRFMEHGGAWIGFHDVFQHEKGDSWPWFGEFMGGVHGHSAHCEPPRPARLSVDDKTHPVVQNIPSFIASPANDWFQYARSPREHKDIRVIMSLDPMNYPIGITSILKTGDTPVVWTNTKYNMIYVSMGHDGESMSDWLQRRIFADALSWVAKKSVKKKTELLTDNSNLPEMIPVQGGAFTLGDDAGDKDEKPAHRVTVSDFSVAKTETTIAQWRKFCMATGRPMPEAPWFQQSEQHPVVNVSWDHAMAYCKWLGDVTGKHYRLPTEAEWEFAARGGIKSKGFPYSGGKNADSIAWLGHKTTGTMPVAQKASNELGLYDMTGNVWEWCSDWYGVEYYSAREAENPKGPASGQFYTLRGGAWDIGPRNNRVTYRNPLAPTSRNHNKGFRVVCDP